SPRRDGSRRLHAADIGHQPHAEDLPKSRDQVREREPYRVLVRTRARSLIGCRGRHGAIVFRIANSGTAKTATKPTGVTGFDSTAIFGFLAEPTTTIRSFPRRRGRLNPHGGSRRRLGATQPAFTKARAAAITSRTRPSRR